MLITFFRCQVAFVILWISSINTNVYGSSCHKKAIDKRSWLHWTWPQPHVYSYKKMTITHSPLIASISLLRFSFLQQRNAERSLAWADPRPAGDFSYLRAPQTPPFMISGNSSMRSCSSVAHLQRAWRHRGEHAVLSLFCICQADVLFGVQSCWTVKCRGRWE